MRAQPLDLSLLAYWEELVYLEAACLARPETAHLAAEVAAELDSWQPLFQADLARRRADAKMRASVAMADLGLDMGIRATYNALLGAAGQNRKAPAFADVFKATLGVLIAPGLRKQIDVAADIIKRLALDAVPTALRDGHVAILTALVTTGKVALDVRDNADVDRVRHRRSTTDWKQAVNAVRLGVYAELLKIGVANGHGKAYAEAFFATGEDPAPVGAPAAPAVAPVEPAPMADLRPE